MPSLYVHVPFCVVKCPYCDFYSAVEQGDAIRQTLAAIEREIAVRAVGTRPETVFAGGGTPTYLDVAPTERLAGALRASVDLSGVREFTVEANPESVRPDRIAAWRRAGATRFSLGVQSFDPAKLAFLGRAHDAATARSAFVILREAGAESINFDLMFAVPGETLESWSRDLDEVIALGPEHVSAYGLTIEPGTDFGRRRRAGELAECDEETWRALFLLTRERLQSAGYEPYEISNFARPGFRCLHNLNYWQNRGYLGIGPSAVSYIGGVRRRNVADWRKYAVAILEGGDATAFEEALGAEGRAAEAVMLGLRLEEGLCRDEFLSLHGIDLFERFAGEIARFCEQGLLERRGSRLAFSAEGRLVANSVIEAFLP
jgi:oxygen-independent coproporphyrinogen-3 oxidase